MQLETKQKAELKMNEELRGKNWPKIKPCEELYRKISMVLIGILEKKEPNWQRCLLRKAFLS